MVKTIWIKGEERETAKKIAIGTWAYAFGPYEENQVPFDTVRRRCGEIGLDGVEIAAFKPHVHPAVIGAFIGASIGLA